MVEFFKSGAEPVVKTVSMKSGLRDRNNLSRRAIRCLVVGGVSMKSGLRDRNNAVDEAINRLYAQLVSMKSGLRDRNNGAEVDHIRGKEALSQ